MQQTDWRWASINEGGTPSKCNGILIALSRFLIGLAVCLGSVVAMVTMLSVLLLRSGPEG